MSTQYTFEKRRGIDDLGRLLLPVQWRLDARSTHGRSLSERPWYDEKLTLPLESIRVSPDEILYSEADYTRENSIERIKHMLAAKTVPLVVDGGNTMRNVVARVENREAESLIGYSFSRIALARKVLDHLHTAPDVRTNNYRSANLHVTFNYEPPQGSELDNFLNALRDKGGFV